MDSNKLPRHVGIIMDGNGRWATLRGKKRTFGHKVGSENVDAIVTHAFNKGIFALTLYAFSSENWLRPKEEVDGLMKLLKTYLIKFAKKLLTNDIKLKVVGAREGLSKELISTIDDVENKTANCESGILNIAVNYGGRQEIVNAVNSLIKKGEEITIDAVSGALYTAESGEPDLIIRTGGEYRLSNFLLFQGAYSELYFTDVLWPDFNQAEFDKALEDISKRKRRFGKV